MKKEAQIIFRILAAVFCLAVVAAGVMFRHQVSAAPQLTETAPLTFAPNVPPPITRNRPALVRVNLETREVTGILAAGIDQPTRYRFWTFNGHVPGPFIRVRVGDTLEVHLANAKGNQMPHNVDIHAVTGPGGGGPLTLASPGQTRVARFQMLHPGIYVYHCGMAPVPEHIANGMYGMILVEPEGGLPRVDREYYVMQSEFYTRGAAGAEGLQALDEDKAVAEKPTYVVFNGRVGAVQGPNALTARVGEKVRLFVGNIGPNLDSAFHVIGMVMDNVVHGGSFTTPEQNVQTTLIPPGDACMVEISPQVPGDYSFVDHSIFRLEQGAIGIIHVDGDATSPAIYQPVQWTGGGIAP